VRTADFDYLLPKDLIAQVPAPQRDQSRLLKFQRPTGALEHRAFPDLVDYLAPEDVLVLNDSQVIPARLHGRCQRTQRVFEVFLCRENSRNDWWAMLRPGRRARTKTCIEIHDHQGEPTGTLASVTEINEEGHRRLRFSGPANIRDHLHELGEVPLPPYITRSATRSSSEDIERYQTVYAQHPGSVAAPTAGLHFTPELLQKIHQAGVIVCKVTLHVGIGTFASVKTKEISEHRMHSEHFSVSQATADTINSAKTDRRRIIAVGTTSLRVLESAVDHHTGALQPITSNTDIFIRPPHCFKIVDGLLTNFHLPCSTLLMLVSAFAAPGRSEGRSLMLSTYAEAVRQRYRFFSYGDAMLIL
jgi:S-adenosylmethionine:tRNA ribosyltransferase-isomerase